MSRLGLFRFANIHLSAAWGLCRDVLSSKEAVQIARSEFLKGKKAQDAASRLAALAVKRYSTDNASVVVVDIRGSKEGWVDPNKSKGGGWLSVFK